MRSRHISLVQSGRTSGMFVIFDAGRVNILKPVMYLSCFYHTQ